LKKINIDYKEGDTVSVKNGIKDPDFGTDISGWRGIADSIYENEEGKLLVRINWDSITLNNMDASQILECDNEGFAWDVMVLEAQEVELSEKRDNEGDVVRAKRKIENTILKG